MIGNINRKDLRPQTNNLLEVSTDKIYLSKKNAYKNYIRDIYNKIND